jgi:hypothetical protein
MIHNTGKTPSPLPKSLNQSTGKYSTRGTGFNDSSWGEQTRGLVKLIVHKLRPESYDKVVAGAKEIVKKTRSSVRTEEIIDLTTDEPPEEFEMVMDLPSDEDSEMDIKDEPENDYRDEDEDADGSDDAAIFGVEEEGTQSHWYY